MTNALTRLRSVETKRLFVILAILAAISQSSESARRAESDEPKHVPFSVKHTHQGMVIDKDTGKPVAGIEVSIILRIMIDAEWTSQDAKAITNPDGTFHCLFYYDGPLQQTTIDVKIHHKGYMRYHEIMSKILVGGVAIDRFIDENLSKIAIRPAREIAGVIVDHEGLPAGDLEIVVYSTMNNKFDGFRSRDDDFTHFSRIRTDSKGRFRAEVAATGPIVVASESKRYPETAWTIKNGNRGHLGSFRLDEAVIVSGRILDKAGRPVVLARIEGTLEYPETSSPVDIYRSVGYYSPDQDVTTTNERGEFAFRPFSLGVFTIDIERQTESDWEKRFVDPVDVYVKKSIRLKSGMKQARVEIRPVPDVTVEVRLIDQRAKYDLFEPLDFSVFGEVQKTRWGLDFTLSRSRSRKIHIPHGLENAEIQTPPFLNGGVKYKLEGDQDYSYMYHVFSLGTIDGDRKDIDIVFYDYPSLSFLVKTDGSKAPDDARIDCVYSKTNDRRFIKLLRSKEIATMFEVKKFKNRGFYDTAIIPYCDVIVTASSEGYEPTSQIVNLKEGERRVLEFVLKKKIKP